MIVLMVYVAVTINRKSRSGVFVAAVDVCALAELLGGLRRRRALEAS